MYSHVNTTGVKPPVHNTTPVVSSFAEAVEAVRNAREEAKATCVQVSEAKKLGLPVDRLYIELDVAIARWEDCCLRAITLSSDIDELRDINKMSFPDGRSQEAILVKMGKLLGWN